MSTISFLKIAEFLVTPLNDLVIFALILFG